MWPCIAGLEVTGVSKGLDAFQSLKAVTVTADRHIPQDLKSQTIY